MTQLLHIARFTRVQDNVPELLAPLTWEEWLRHLAVHEEWPDKNGRLWSPTEYAPGKTRAVANVIALYAYVLDMDSGERVEPFLDQWSELEFFLHTSYQHTKEHPRWRAVFPFVKPQPGGEAWRPIWERLAWNLAKHTADGACKNADRIYYYPSHPPGSEDHFLLRHPGEWLDADAYTEMPPRPVAPPRPAADIPRGPAGRVDGMLLVDRAVEVAQGRDHRHGEGWHAGCKWLAIQLKDNLFSESEGETFGDAYIHAAPRDKTRDKPPGYHEGELKRLLAWAFSQSRRDPWAPKVWEAPVPIPDPPPEGREVGEAEFFVPPTPPAARAGYDAPDGMFHPPGEDPPSDPEGPEAQPQRRRILFKAPELMGRVLPERRYVIPELLPEGLGIFAGKTKTGKSWAALGLGVAVAAGGRAFGKHPVEQGDVLYLALEDNEESLQERLGLLLQGEPAPERLTFAIEWRRTNQGGIRDIERWLAANPDARLVMIDVLTKIRPRSKGGSNNQQYEEDYEICDPLKLLADQYRVSILLLHHLRKLTSEDPLDQVLGSVGMTGAPDTAWVFRRARKDPKATLLITGRRIKEEQERALQWDGPAVSWLDLGDADELSHSMEQEEILAYLRESGPGMKKLKQIADALAKNPGTVRKLCQKLKDSGHVISDAWGTYGIREALF